MPKFTPPLLQRWNDNIGRFYLNQKGNALRNRRNPARSRAECGCQLLQVNKALADERSPFAAWHGLFPAELLHQFHLDFLNLQQPLPMIRQEIVQFLMQVPDL